jgi:hypothetical protein
LALQGFGKKQIKPTVAQDGELVQRCATQARLTYDQWLWDGAEQLAGEERGKGGATACQQTLWSARADAVNTIDSVLACFDNS